MRKEIDYLRHPTTVSREEFVKKGALAIAALGVMIGGYGVSNLHKASADSNPITYTRYMREALGATPAVALAALAVLALGRVARVNHLLR